MEIEHIRELIGLMKENDLTEVRIIEGETRLFLKRGSDVEMTAVPMVATAPAAVSAPAAPVAPTVVPAEKEAAATINSPMVGTFYTSPAPDVDAYVRVGDHVSADTVVCIIEAMKVMNEIKAEVSGTIEKIVAKNGEPVEFGQPLFQVRPD